MCNNYKCTCPRHTHLFIEESNRCIKISNSSKPPKYGEPCSVQIPCADNFICQSNHCRCSAECGPYLKKDGLCACEKNTQVEFLYTKVLPACLAVLVVGSCIIYISYKSGCCSLPKPSSSANASRVSNGHSPYSPQANSSHSPYSPQANSTLLSAGSPNTSFPTAPPLPPDEDAPPSYDEVMGSSHHSWFHNSLIWILYKISWFHNSKHWFEFFKEIRDFTIPNIDLNFLWNFVISQFIDLNSLWNNIIM